MTEEGIDEFREKTLFSDRRIIVYPDRIEFHSRREKESVAIGEIAPLVTTENRKGEILLPNVIALGCVPIYFVAIVYFGVNYEYLYLPMILILGSSLLCTAFLKRKYTIFYRFDGTVFFEIGHFGSSRKEYDDFVARITWYLVAFHPTHESPSSHQNTTKHRTSRGR